MLKKKTIVKAKIFSFIVVFLPILLLLGCFWVLKMYDYASFGFSITLPLIVVFNVFLLLYLVFKKQKRLLYPAVALITFFVLFSSFLQFSFDKKNDEKAISILSYNVKSFSIINKGARDVSGKYILDFIETKDPDVLVIQEFFYPRLKYLDQYPYRFLGYRKDFDKTLLIILSKYPIVDKGYIDFEDTKNNAIYADIIINGEKVRVYNLHLQSFGVHVDESLLNTNMASSLLKRISQSQKKRLQQVEMVKEHIKDVKQKRIICGDFNSTQFSSTYRKLKKGMKDTFVEKGNGLGMTYNLLGYPLRLDYVLVDQSMEVFSHENYELNFSDHEPVFTKIKIH